MFSPREENGGKRRYVRCLPFSLTSWLYGLGSAGRKREERVVRKRPSPPSENTGGKEIDLRRRSAKKKEEEGGRKERGPFFLSPLSTLGRRKKRVDLCSVLLLLSGVRKKGEKKEGKRLFLSFGKEREENAFFPPTRTFPVSKRERIGRGRDTVPLSLLSLGTGREREGGRRKEARHN